MKSLADFPGIFDGKVVVVPDSGVEMGSDLLTAISKLEKKVGSQPGQLTISKEIGSDANRMILSTFEIGDRSKDIVEKLKINLSPEPDEKNTPTPASPPEVEPTATPTATGSDAETNLENFLNDVGAKEGQDTEMAGPSEIEIPGFSVIATKDLGLVGLVREKDHTTLIFMASSPENLTTFIGKLAMNGLSGCLIQNNVAACKVSGGSEFEPQG